MRSSSQMRLRPSVRTPNSWQGALPRRMWQCFQRSIERSRSASADNAAAALRDVEDPLSRLIASGVLFQSGRASPAAVGLAADAASSQGWRRPLLAWLGVQLALAEKAGDTAEAERLRRRISVAEVGK